MAGITWFFCVYQMSRYNSAPLGIVATFSTFNVDFEQRDFFLDGQSQTW